MHLLAFAAEVSSGGIEKGRRKSAFIFLMLEASSSFLAALNWRGIANSALHFQPRHRGT
jgi:hypothetical protein